jgi:predicted enzyme related to lactoylglutathione lyase
MSEQQMPKHGTFCWNELSTTDLDAAQGFYKELLGWEIKEGSAPGGGMRYNEIVADGRHVGGIFQSGPECGGVTAAHWRLYVAVDDVDASAARVAELGGKVTCPPTDIPRVGRFCVVEDPTGAAISLITLKGANA